MKFSRILLSTMLLLFVGSTSHLVGQASSNIALDYSVSQNEQKERSFHFLYFEALRAKVWGRTADAIKFFEQCLIFDDKNDVVYYELALLYFQERRNELGMNAMQKAASLNPKNIWYQYYLVNIFEMAKNNAKAIEVLEKIVTENSDKLEYLYHLAALYTTNNDNFKAAELYKKIELLSGENDKIAIERHRLYALAGKDKESISELNVLIKKYPKDPTYLILLGDYYTQTGRSKTAMKNYKKAEKINPDFGNLHLSYANFFRRKNDIERAYQELGIAFESNDITVETKKGIMVQLILQQDSIIDTLITQKNRVLIEQLKTKYSSDGELWFLSGNYYIALNRPKEGYAELEKSIEISPDRPEVWSQLITYYFTVPDLNKVLSLCDNGILLFPEIGEFYFYKALVYREQKKLEQAKEMFYDALKNNSQNPNLTLQVKASLGDLYYLMEQKDSAFAVYDEILKVQPNNAMVLNNYAYYLSLENTDLEKAEEMSSRCIKIEPNNPTYLDTYAWVLYKKGQYFLAKFYIERAISKGIENNSEVMDHYGDILIKNGEVEKAVDAWKKALKIDPTNKEIERKILENSTKTL